MKPQTIAMMIYLELLIMALMMDKIITAVFVIFTGLLVMAMYQYGGDRLRDIPCDAGWSGSIMRKKIKGCRNGI